MNIEGIVLAAGRSTRMGTSKAQLEVRPGVTFLEHAVHALREADCRYVVAVVNEAEDWTQRLADVAGAAVVINDRPQSQQIDSIRLGLAYLPDDADAVIILPVDCPAVKVETVRLLVHAFEFRRPAVLVPIYKGQPGHPVILARSVFADIMTDPLPRGAETIVQRHTDRVEIEVDDPGVLFDIDTPQEYQQLIAMQAERLDARAAAEALITARRGGQAIATVKSLNGASAGLHVLVFADGTTRGSLGVGSLDEAAKELAASVIASGDPRLHELNSGEQLFCEVQVPADHLVIVGAGHIAVPLAQMGAMLGFRVTVLDDREEFATEARFPHQADVRRMDFDGPFTHMSFDAQSFVLLVTRAHKYDFDCLREILSRAELPRYIGMIGSRRRVRAAFHALLEGGVPAERLGLVHAPVGLDIGAETPAEIAVSIMAELIRARSGTGTGAPLGEHERVLERFFAAKKGDD